MKSMNDKMEVFERMPVRRAVLVQALPAIISQMVALIYNLADTYFVGRLNLPAQSAAVSLAMPIFLFLTAISNLFGVGGASALSQSLGRKDEESAGQISSISFYFGMGSALLFSLILIPALKPLLYLIGASSDTIGPASGYLTWTVLAGGIPTVLNILLANLIRSEGKAGIASIGVSMGGILNIILDPFFILPRFLGMGAAGAGLATAISNLAGLLFFLGYIFFYKTTVISLDIRNLRYTRVHLGRILTVGVSAFFQYALTVVAASFTTRFISFAGTEAVAAFGIQKKLDQVTLYFSIGMANGLLPILAYNYGSGNRARREQAFRFGVGVAVSFALLLLVIYEFFASSLAALFIQDPETVRLSAAFLRIQVVAQPLVAVNYPMIIQFQAMGKAKEAMACSLIRKGLLDIPLLFVMNRLYPLYGCLWVQPIVDCIALMVCITLYRRVEKRGEEGRM